MENPAQFTSLIETLDKALSFAKFFVATSFGIAFLANAFSALNLTKPSQTITTKNANPLTNQRIGLQYPHGAVSRRHLLFPKVSRAAFLFGIIWLSIFCSFVAIHPARQTETLVILGVALVLSVVTHLWESNAKPIPTLSFLASGIVWLLTMGTAYFTSLFPQNPVLSVQKPLGELSSFHIGTAIIGSALCIMSFLAAILYLAAFRLLKSKKLEGLPALPSLELLDRLIEKSTIWGLFSMTCSLVSGLGLAFVSNPPQQVATIKVIWAFAVWGFYAISIYGRGFWGWRGKAGALMSVWGILLIAGTLFGTVFGTVFGTSLGSAFHTP